MRHSIRKIKRLLADIEKAKDAHREIDTIINDCLKRKCSAFSEGKTRVVLVDNFGQSNVCFRTTSMRHYTLKLERVK